MISVNPWTCGSHKNGAMPLCTKQPTDIACQLLRDEPALLSSLDFGASVKQGGGKGPSLLIGDQSEIPLLTDDTDGFLDHRMALLAQPGDIVLVRRREPDFEHYLAQYLGISDVTFVAGNQDDARPLALQARTSDRLLKASVNTARASGGLTIKSYLTTGHSWRLAQTIGEAADCCVHVYGPSPRVVRRANDKLWFAQLARQVIGRDATPPTMAAFGPAGAAGLVKRIAANNRQVIVKVPDSAGSAGNVRLDSAAVERMSLHALRRFLLARLRATGWDDTYPILVGVWDENVVCSPSVQLWIPAVSDAPPTVDRIFEQRVTGPAAGFVGGVPSDLPGHIQSQLRSEAVRIAAVLQQLGYFGRCSLDAVLCQDKLQPPQIHWIECNGRWGGVSIPMTASQQLTGQDPAIAIAQEVLPAMQMDTPALIRPLQDLLFDIGKRQVGIIVSSPPGRPQGMLLNLLAIADRQITADQVLQEAVERVTRR